MRAELNTADFEESKNRRQDDVHYIERDRLLIMVFQSASVLAVLFYQVSANRIEIHPIEDRAKIEQNRDNECVLQHFF